MEKPKLASLAALLVLLLFQKAVHKIFLETFYFKKKKTKTYFGTMFCNYQRTKKLWT